MMEPSGKSNSNSLKIVTSLSEPAAEVEDDEGTPDQTELSEVRWFTREEARRLLRGEIEGTFCPQPLAIAHQLLKAWAEE